MNYMTLNDRCYQSVYMSSKFERRQIFDLLERPINDVSRRTLSNRKL